MYKHTKAPTTSAHDRLGNKCVSNTVRYVARTSADASGGTAAAARRAAAAAAAGDSVKGGSAGHRSGGSETVGKRRGGSRTRASVRSSAVGALTIDAVPARMARTSGLSTRWTDTQWAAARNVDPSHGSDASDGSGRDGSGGSDDSTRDVSDVSHRYGARTTMACR
jgi:hypothetical protein